MVMPLLWSSWMMAKISFTNSGERPMDGSSISTILGSVMRARPVANICCSPPDSVPASWR